MRRVSRHCFVLLLLLLAAGLGCALHQLPSSKFLKKITPYSISNPEVVGKRCTNFFPSLSIAAWLFLPLSPALAQEWDFLNGHVSLPDPVVLKVNNKEPSLTLRNPQVIGWGGGGAVFKFDDGTKQLLKVSWTNSAKSVERECTTLQKLEQAHVESAERCLGQFTYSQESATTSSNGRNSKIDEQSNSRVMILVEPYVDNAVSSVKEVPSEDAQKLAVEQISRTMVQMVAANIVTIDVQPLISQTTGDVIFVDMTEAQVLKPPPFSFLDKTLMTSFVTEMMTLIPEDLQPLASKTILEEISRLKESGVQLSDEALELLDS